MRCEKCGKTWTIPADRKDLAERCPFCGGMTVSSDLTSTPLNTIYNVLRYIYTQYDRNWLRDQGKMTAVLHDLIPEQDREKRMLLSFLECGGLQYMEEAHQSEPDRYANIIGKLAERMMERYLISKEITTELAAVFTALSNDRPYMPKNIRKQNSPADPDEPVNQTNVSAVKTSSPNLIFHCEIKQYSKKPENLQPESADKIVIEAKNTGSAEFRFERSSVIIDSGIRQDFGSGVVKCGGLFYFHVAQAQMEKLSTGAHKLDLYLNDTRVYTTSITYVCSARKTDVTDVNYRQASEPADRKTAQPIQNLKLSCDIRQYSITTEHLVNGSEPEYDRYESIVVIAENNSKENYTYREAVIQIDSGNKMCWNNKPLTLIKGTTVFFHLGYFHMKQLLYGTHEVKFYLDDRLVYSSNVMLKPINNNRHPEDRYLSIRAGVRPYSISTEREVKDGSTSDTYYSFVFEVINRSWKDYPYSSAYVRIDQGEELRWSQGRVRSGCNPMFHIFYSYMKNVAAGAHEVDFYINNRLQMTAHLAIPQKDK